MREPTQSDGPVPEANKGPELITISKETFEAMKRCLKRCLISAELSYKDESLARAIRNCLNDAGETL